MYKLILLWLILVLSFTDIKSQNFNIVDSNDVFFDFINSKCFNNASVSFYAYNLDDNKKIYSYNENLSLVPASVLKTVTTATALQVLRPFYRFKTKLQYTGTIDSLGNLNGNLIIKGGGDPTLGSERFKKTYYSPFFLDKWIDTIKKSGIKNINGNLIIDDRIFDNNIPTTWVWGDIGNYYGAGAFGISIFDNTYKLILASPDTAKGPVKIKQIIPDIDSMRMENYLLSSKRNRDMAYIFGDPLTNIRLVQGTIPLKRDSFIVKGSIPNPPKFLGKYFLKYLINNNLKLNGTITIINNKDFNYKTDTIPKKNIYTTKSPYLKNIITLTNTYSINLYAQHIFKAISLRQVKQATNITAANYIKNFWRKKGINTSGMELYDGCGLSRYNVITAKQIAEILIYMNKKSKYFKYFYNSLPIAGKSGTLSRTFRNKYLKNNLRAKSGTITKVKNYAGYFKTLKGKNIAFVIMINNYNGSSKNINNKIQNLLTKIYFRN